MNKKAGRRDGKETVNLSCRQSYFAFFLLFKIEKKTEANKKNNFQAIEKHRSMN